MRLLIVGALGAETLPILSALGSPRPLSRRLVAGQLGEHSSVAVLTCGVGPDKATRRTAAALTRWRAEAVVSIGTCGALCDTLAVGQVLTARRLLWEGQPCRDPLPWPGAMDATLVTVAAPVFDPARRAALAAAGATACEMEAAAVQRAAAGLPLCTLKVVSDLAGAATDDPPRRPSPFDIVRFTRQARRLVAHHLLPLLHQPPQAM